MVIEKVVVGEIGTNCYLVGWPEQHRAFIIDPGDDYEKIKESLNRKKWTPEFIVITHGHWDHISAAHLFNLPVYIHQLDADCLTDSVRNFSKLFSRPYSGPVPSRLLEENDLIELGPISLRVLHTPGHSPGSICLLSDRDKVVFTGDTLFCGNVGRTDLPDGDEEELYNSIRNKLFSLPDETSIQPGHGPNSIIGKEKKRILCN